jgi:hypothetical protein
LKLWRDNFQPKEYASESLEQVAGRLANEHVFCEEAAHRARLHWRHWQKIEAARSI